MSTSGFAISTVDDLDPRLAALHDRLKANDWIGARQICRAMFGCGEEPLDALAQDLTASGLYMLCTVLRVAQAQPPDRRPAAALAIPLVVDLDFPDPDARERVLRAAAAILAAPPIAPAT